jgi:Uncharacterised protein family (UPF0236)
MTDGSVAVSITIKLENVVMEFQKKVPIEAVEESIHTLTVGLGQQVLHGVIQVLDDRIALTVPSEWHNVGTEVRWMVSSLGAVRYKRRVYQDEQRRRRAPVDDVFGLVRYGRMSGRVQEMGAFLASSETYRLAADQLSYLTRTAISPSAVQRMVWSVGNRIADGEEAERRRVFEGGEQLEGGKIAAAVLYGESDGVWVHLQREARHSTEVRVATLCTGRKRVGKDRFRLENKLCMTAIGLNSEAWQEHILREAHLAYDLSQTRILISGGDGNQWVRHTFERMDLPQQFVLDRFHLQRAARRAYQDRGQARRVVTRLRQEGFDAVAPELQQHLQQAEGNQHKLLLEFYQYVHNNRDGLLDLEYRACSLPACLGGIEGNVDKLVVHRMKGRGCSWRLPGVRAMLALCRNADQLRSHAYRYLPVQTPPRSYRSTQCLEVEYAETAQGSMPVFQGPHQNRPWVRSLHQLIYGR